eukprot:CAMPEP_0170549014 /NCGR_PEP_ID=MMETSP0211-20121228/7188_1 /TAXON_ID=311385 /ORGANISM="Pseudokeronopsis sp., Strain OXSARD2" /LENGTH=51 /DNA_ID=CAMNT_0010854777 /DNA_START=206 /DNA_END=361 /DNA_ORIENTATION=-
MEVSVDHGKFKSSITEIVNSETDSLFGILRGSETLYNIEDPFLSELNEVSA